MFRDECGALKKEFAKTRVLEGNVATKTPQMTVVSFLCRRRFGVGLRWPVGDDEGVMSEPRRPAIGCAALWSALEKRCCPRLHLSCFNENTVRSEAESGGWFVCVMRCDGAVKLRLDVPRVKERHTGGRRGDSDGSGGGGWTRTSLL